MAESKEEREKRLLKELEGKNIAHYSILLGAWIQTRMQRDKTLVTLSSAGVGLLVTLLTTVEISEQWIIYLFGGAFSGFGLTIWSSLQIYQRNSKHIEDSIRGSSKDDSRLEKYDKLSIRAFYVGAIFTISIGIVSSLT